MLRFFVALIFLIPMLMLLASHLGAFHPLGDSLAVFRGPVTAVGILSLLVFFKQGLRWLAIASGMLLLWSSFTVLAPRFAFSAALDAPYALYQKNMSFRMPNTGLILTDILAKSPDFITLQEVDQENLALMWALKDKYPAQAFCPFAAVGGVAVMARWPIMDGSMRCDAGSGMVAMQVDTPDGPVWVVALHLHWAYPFGQVAQVRQMRAALQELEGPVVLGGDFNMVPWSNTMRVITSATGTRRIGAPKQTLPLFDGLYNLPIDHVLVNANNRPADIWMRPQLGSDHFGLLARFYLR